MRARTRCGYGSLLIVPRQAAFFAAALADLQGMIPRSQVPADFKITGGVLFVAPPFRHTHFGGRQVVVHDRTATHQEIFAYNLYPGPSAKKGVYSMLLDIGEREGWTTNHCAAVAVVTPYENQLILMHEGASGGGKSEMTEHIHRMEDGRLLIGRNVITKEERTLNLPEACHLRPIADDMACAHPSYQTAAWPADDRRCGECVVCARGSYPQLRHGAESGAAVHRSAGAADFSESLHCSRVELA